jgi:hypothetical protein
MQAQADSRMPRDALDERQVRALVGLLEYAVEISYRLVRVNQQHEMEFGQCTAPSRKRALYNTAISSTACYSEILRLRRERQSLALC